MWYFLLLACIFFQYRKPTLTEVWVILGSGGHSSEMKRIIKYVREYPVGRWLLGFDESSETLPENAKYSRLFRPRKVGQSYISSIITFLVSVVYCTFFLFARNSDPKIVQSS